MALAVGSAALALAHVDHLGAGPADPEGPLEQRSLASEHHQDAFLEQVAADNQIQPIIKENCKIPSPCRNPI